MCVMGGTSSNILLPQGTVIYSLWSVTIWTPECVNVSHFDWLKSSFVMPRGRVQTINKLVECCTHTHTHPDHVRSFHHNIFNSYHFFSIVNRPRLKSFSYCIHVHTSVFKMIECSKYFSRQMSNSYWVCIKMYWKSSCDPTNYKDMALQIFCFFCLCILFHVMVRHVCMHILHVNTWIVQWHWTTDICVRPW